MSPQLIDSMPNIVLDSLAGLIYYLRVEGVMRYNAANDEFIELQPGTDIYKAAHIRTVLTSVRGIRNFREQLAELAIDGGEPAFISYVANRLANLSLAQIEFLLRRAPFTTLGDFGRLLGTAEKARV